MTERPRQRRVSKQRDATQEQGSVRQGKDKQKNNTIIHEIFVILKQDSTIENIFSLHSNHSFFNIAGNTALLYLFVSKSTIKLLARLSK